NGELGKRKNSKAQIRHMPDRVEHVRRIQKLREGETVRHQPGWNQRIAQQVVVEVLPVTSEKAPKIVALPLGETQSGDVIRIAANARRKRRQRIEQEVLRVRKRMQV